MKITTALSGYDFSSNPSDLNIVLFGHTHDPNRGSVGATLKNSIYQERLIPDARAWDLLSLALAVMSSDLAGHRKKSPDGWTREFDLTVQVIDFEFWASIVPTLERLFSFLTTDRWSIRFVGGGNLPPNHPNPILLSEDSVVLLSGGLDSYIGAIDLVDNGLHPVAVSQTVRGDAKHQRDFAASIGSGLNHFQFSHVAKVPDPETPPSQRARSIIFLAYGVLIATSLDRYHSGEEVQLFVCENGLISINPPLTSGRLGSLSTRTTHPVVLALLQQILDFAGLRVKIVNPYRLKTKGEMMIECRNQTLLATRASLTTSCGRFKQFGYKHCGRCVPCMVRRAAFLKWGILDSTHYVYDDLGRDDGRYSGFDDVRSMLIGIAESREIGIDRWLGATLSSSLVTSKRELKETVERGLTEVGELLTHLGAR